MTQWLIIGFGLLVHAVTLTAFFYREFATKRDLAGLGEHLRELFAKDHQILLTKIDTIQADIREIKDAIKGK